MTDIKGFVEEYAAVWSTQDVEKILSFFTENCVYEDVALGADYRSLATLLQQVGVLPPTPSES